MPGANLRVRTKFFLPRDGLEKSGAGMRCVWVQSPISWDVQCVLGQLSQRVPMTSVGLFRLLGSPTQTPQHTHGPIHSPTDHAVFKFNIFSFGPICCCLVGKSRLCSEPVSSLVTTTTTMTTEMRILCQVQLLNLIFTDDHMV